MSKSFLQAGSVAANYSCTMQNLRKGCKQSNITQFVTARIYNYFEISFVLLKWASFAYLTAFDAFSAAARLDTTVCLAI